MTNNPYLTVQSVAKHYGISVPTVWRWLKSNPDFPKPVRLGVRITRWRIEDIESYTGIAKAEEKK